MKKVLIIAYYWPPSGGGGVQRWLKFVKYLPQFGWKPVVVVPENPEYPVLDYSLEKDIPPEAEIIKLPIWEPYGIFKKLTGRKKEERVSNGLLLYEKNHTLMENFSLWLRGNFLIPDPRVFWVKPTTRRLKKILPEINPEIIITTGTPHSIHLIGLKLKQFSGIPWIADLRDPWSQLDLFDKFYPTKLARIRQRRMEKKALQKANQVITVSETWANELSKLIKKTVKVVTNGFDQTDVDITHEKDTGRFLISHVGIINSFRNPEFLWEALNELCKENIDFNKKLVIQIIGSYNDWLKEELEKYEHLKNKLVFSGYINHKEVKVKYAESDCLLLLQNRSKNEMGHIPGKVFEYLASRKPILALVKPESDIGKIINGLKAGYACNYIDKDCLKKAVISIFNHETESVSKEKLDQFSRLYLTEQLEKIIMGTIRKTTYNPNIVSEKKRVLIITYYWPPSGGVAVQRWLKFVKYLPEFNWEPVVVVPDNPVYPLVDKKLLDEINQNLEILRVPIVEPARIFTKLSKKEKAKKMSAGFMSDSKKGLVERISIWLRANIIIPDARRFWIKPVVKTVSKYLESNKIDAIITTGPPHSVHLSGLKIKQKNPSINWIADFRDPWTKIDFYEELKPTKIANQFHHRWEKKVVQTANSVITVSDANSEDYRLLGAQKVDTITNGFDPHDFENINTTLDEKFTVSHIGSFMANRNFDELWKAFSDLVKENKGFKNDFRLRFVGNVDFSVRKHLDEFGLTDYAEFIGFVPQEEAIRFQKTSHVLLLVINKTGNPKGMITGKIFGYLASNRQILLVGPEDGDAAKIIEQTKSGLSADSQSTEKIKNCIEKFYESYKNKQDLFSGNQEEINKFSRRKLTENLVNILNLEQNKSI